jgi:subfamily B ATP-binding cassette protein MsbA
MKKTRNLSSLSHLVRRHLSRYWKQSVSLVLLSILAATLTSLQSLSLAPALEISLPSSKESPALAIGDISLNNIGITFLIWIKELTGENPLYLMFFIALFFVLIGIIAAIVDFFAHMLSSWININANADLQLDLYRHLISLDLSFFLKSRTNEISSRFVNDVGEVTVSLDLSMRQMLESSVQILIYGYLLFQTSHSLALAVVAISVAHFFITRVLKNRIQSSTSVKLDKLADSSHVLNESLSNIKIIKIFSAEKLENSRFKKTLELLRAVSMRYSFYKHSETPLRKITDATALGLILVLSYTSFLSNELTSAGFFMFMLIVRQTIAPISIFAQSTIRLYNALGSAERVLEVFESRPEQKQGVSEIADFKESIEFKNVTFGYDIRRPVLNNINFKLKRGEILAVVGPSGAGKSTIVDILIRLFDPQTGQVLIDGVPVEKYSLNSYRSLFGVVPQESLLNHLTVAENIAFGRGEIIDEKLETAAHISNSAGFINNLSMRYQTQIGDRGVRLSGGQRQRIAIARAIYVNPRVLILDEATSSLDSESERSVQIAIDRILRESTALIITHRLSTIIKADRIMVLKSGEIDAIGPHSELIDSCELYRKFYEMQYEKTGKNGV